jgi:hypothetical protein
MGHLVMFYSGVINPTRLMIADVVSTCSIDGTFITVGFQISSES